MLAYVRTHSEATCKGLLQLEETFVEVEKTCISTRGLWNNNNNIYL